MAKPELTLEAMQSTIESLEDNVTKLHEALEKKGVNSRGTKDIFGRVFSMPVDAEHKATQFVILDTSNPHSRAFHVSWWGFFSSFFSMFAAAGVHEEGDLPQPEQERDRHGQHPRGRRQHRRALLHRHHLRAERRGLDRLPLHHRPLARHLRLLAGLVL